MAPTNENDDYATRRVESWIGDECTIHDDLLRADNAMAVAREVWADSELYGPRYDRVVVRNERTGAVCDTISWDSEASLKAKEGRQCT